MNRFERPPTQAELARRRRLWDEFWQEVLEECAKSYRAQGGILPAGYLEPRETTATAPDEADDAVR
jgi:hypothetical protein